MGQFGTLARQELDEVTVTFGRPSGFAGSVWNDNENAFVKIYITNSSTVTLRDVVADAHIFGSARFDPWKFWGFLWGDGEQSWNEIEPGASVEYWVRLLGTSAGNAHMYVGISAEIVPYASDWHAAHTDFTVTAA